MPSALALGDENALSRGQRDHPRARLSVPARLVTFEGTVDCTLIDLSCTGAKIAGGKAPRVGGMVVIEGLPVELFGTVRWSKRDSFGVEFDMPLPSAQVVQLRHYADLEMSRQKADQIDYARGWVLGIYNKKG